VLLVHDDAPVPHYKHPVLLKVKNPVFVQEFTFPVEQVTVYDKQGTQEV